MSGRTTFEGIPTGMLWRLIPVVLSAVLMAAHFSRAGTTALMLLSLAMPLVLLVRQPWAVRLVQLALVIGGFEWLRTLWKIAARRMESGQPWVRMAVILGIVSLFTWASALVFRSPVMRATWSGDEAD
ncbi:MAG: hypothetical protein P8125_04145 [Gemmatimonadota bacterium]|jgi:hypothetical protein